MIPLLDLKALRLCRFVWLATIATLAAAQTPIQTAQNAQNTPSITKYTDINVGSVVVRPFFGALVLNSSLGPRAAKGGISTGRFTLTGKKGDGWSITNGSAVPFTLTGPKGGTLQVTALTFDPSTPTTGTFPASGTTSEFSVGVTLAAGTGAKPAGPYTGSFNLSVTDTTTGRTSATAFIVRTNLDQIISLSSSVGLVFGSIVAGSQTSLVVVDPSGGRTVSSGNATLVGGTHTAASFTASGNPGQAYTISLPASASLSDGHSHTMSVDAFSCTVNPLASGQLSGSGSQDFQVGGTLTVGANQAPGAYTGTFNVTVVYNP
jgi:hypothetical protein